MGDIQRKFVGFAHKPQKVTETILFSSHRFLTFGFLWFEEDQARFEINHCCLDLQTHSKVWHELNWTYMMDQNPLFLMQGSVDRFEFCWIKFNSNVAFLAADWNLCGGSVTSAVVRTSLVLTCRGGSALFFPSDLYCQSDFLFFIFLRCGTEEANSAAVSSSSSGMVWFLQQRKQKKAPMASGKPARKQPISGASLNTGWMNRGQEVSQTQTNNQQWYDDVTYDHCGFCFINDALDTLTEAVSSLHLRHIQLTDQIPDQVFRPRPKLHQLTSMVPSRTPSRKSSSWRSVSTGPAGW